MCYGKIVSTDGQADDHSRDNLHLTVAIILDRFDFNLCNMCQSREQRQTTRLENNTFLRPIVSASYWAGRHSGGLGGKTH